MIPAIFKNIPLNNYEDGPCSPAIDQEFVGIEIRSPQVIFIDADMSFPVCGSYRFHASFFNRFECLSFEMALVAVNASSHIPYIGNLRFLDYETSTRKYNENEEGFVEKTAGGWFNSDLYFFIEDLPRVPAVYHVFAIIGECKSNVVTIQVKAA
jgi:hypothetical protein